MKQFPSILAAVAIMAITACTKEIDLDLKNDLDGAAALSAA